MLQSFDIFCFALISKMIIDTPRRMFSFVEEGGLIIQKELKN